MPDNTEEQITKHYITMILLGKFEPAFMNYLAWKNTYPLLNHVTFLQLDNSAGISAFDNAPNYILNPATEKIQETISDGLVTFLTISNNHALAFADLTDICSIASQQSEIFIIYMDESTYTAAEITALQNIGKVVIIFGQQHCLPDISPQLLHRHIHWHDPLIFINVFESLCNIILRPDLTAIGIDFADLKCVFSANARAYIGSAIVDGKSSIRELFNKATSGNLRPEHLHEASGVYAMLLQEEHDMSLKNLNEFGNVLCEHFAEDCLSVFGYRHNQDLVDGELQIILIAVVDPVRQSSF